MLGRREGEVCGIKFWSTDDTAKVKVKITSVDMSVAATKTIGEVMSMAVSMKPNFD